MCLLKKALYGLKQAPRAWFSTFSRYLIDYRFIQSTADSSLFVHKTASSFTALLLYVDDIILTGSCTRFLDQLTKNFQANFSMKDLGVLSYFLGVEVQWQDSALHLSQTKYIKDVLQRAGMAKCKPSPTPAVLRSSRSHDTDSDPFAHPQFYRSIVGSLQYITITRPKVAYAVNTVCQSMHSPSNGDFMAVKRILRYLQGMVSHVLLLQKSDPHFYAYSDSD